MGLNIQLPTTGLNTIIQSTRKREKEENTQYSSRYLTCVTEVFFSKDEMEKWNLLTSEPLRGLDGEILRYD